MMMVLVMLMMMMVMTLTLDRVTKIPRPRLLTALLRAYTDQGGLAGGSRRLYCKGSISGPP